MKQNKLQNDVTLFLQENGFPETVEVNGGPFDGLDVYFAEQHRVVCLPTSPEIVEQPSKLSEWFRRNIRITSLSVYELTINKETLVYQYKRSLKP